MGVTDAVGTLTTTEEKSVGWCNNSKLSILWIMITGTWKESTIDLHHAISAGQIKQGDKRIRAPRGGQSIKSKGAATGHLQKRSQRHGGSNHKHNDGYVSPAHGLRICSDFICPQVKQNNRITDS